MSLRTGGIFLTLGILLIDDNEPYRAGLRAILDSAGEIDVRGQAQTVRWIDAGTAEDGLRKVASQQPDIALVDLRLPDRLGITNPKVGLDVTKRILRDWPAVKVVVLTVCDNDDLVDEALRAGARGYLVKDADDHRSDLLRTLQAVANDEVILGKPAGDRLSTILKRDPLATSLPPPFDQLHPVRDRKFLDIVELIAEGLEYKEIARRLDTPASTINNHISDLVKRLNLPSRQILYFWAGRVLGR